MPEIRIHGRGGQGAQVGCQILARAFFLAGRWVQAFAAYGSERRGAPVTAFVRVDDAPIHLRCDIERADHAIVLDTTLLGAVSPTSLTGDALVVVNAPAGPCGRMPGAQRIIAIDATTIAERHGLGPIVATAMLGAFVGATGLLSLDHLLAAVEDESPAKKAENVAACAEAYAEGRAAAPARGADAPEKCADAPEKCADAPEKCADASEGRAQVRVPL